MVNGPPCAVCGFTLRWLPQQSSWGCDRCQRMFPASGPGAPQQQAAPQQPSQQPWQQPPGPSQPPGAWAPPGAQPPQGFAPPQQQGFGAPQQRGFAPPGAPPPQQGFAPPPQQGFAPPPQQGFGAPTPQQGYGAPPSQYAPPGAPGPGYGQPPAHAPYSPQPAAPIPVPTTGGKKSGKGLVIGIVAAVLAIGGGAVAFVMLRGGGGASAGGSRTEVVKATLAALGNGDVDGVIKLADPIGIFGRVVDCDGKTKAREPEPEGDKELSELDKEQRDPNKQLERMKKELGDYVPGLKGAKIELVEIVTKEPAAPSDEEYKTDDQNVKRVGDRVMRGCVAKVHARFHRAKLKIKVTPAGEKTAMDQEVEIGMMQVGTGFWVMEAPRVSVGSAGLTRELTAIRDKVCACPDAACAEKLKDEFKASPRAKTIKKAIKALPEADQKKLDAIEDEIKACEKKLNGETQAAVAIEGITRFKDKMCECKDSACVDKVTQEMTVWAKSQEDDKLSEEDLAKVKTISEEMGKCMVKVSGAGSDSGTGIGTTIVTAAADGDFPTLSNMPPECEDYRKSLIKITSCKAFPESSKPGIIDGYRTFYDAMKKMDQTTMQTMVKTCADAAVQMAQLGSQMGC